MPDDSPEHISASSRIKALRNRSWLGGKAAKRR
jgi:hypothetical protein